MKRSRFFIGLIVFTFLGFYLFFQNRINQGRQKYLNLILHDEVLDVRKSDQGFWIIKCDTSLIHLMGFGACIDTIEKGDSVYKKAGSFEITINKKSQNFKAYKYDCWNRK